MSFKSIFVKVKKEVSIGTLLSIVIPISVSIIAFGFKMRSDVNINSDKVNNLEESTKELREDFKQETKDVQREIDSKFDKLDKKIDKILHHLID